MKNLKIFSLLMTVLIASVSAAPDISANIKISDINSSIPLLAINESLQKSYKSVDYGLYIQSVVADGKKIDPQTVAISDIDMNPHDEKKIYNIYELKLLGVYCSKNEGNDSVVLYFNIPQAVKKVEITYCMRFKNGYGALSKCVVEIDEAKKLEYPPKKMEPQRD